MSRFYKMLNEMDQDVDLNEIEELTASQKAKIKARFHQSVRRKRRFYGYAGKAAAAAVILIMSAAVTFCTPVGAGIAEKIRDTFSSDDGHMEFTVDIENPDTESEIPITDTAEAGTGACVMQAGLHEFTPDEVRAWTEILFEGNRAFDADGSGVPSDWQFHSGWHYLQDQAAMWEGTDDYDRTEKEQVLKVFTDTLHGKTAEVYVIKHFLPEKCWENLFFSYRDGEEDNFYESFPQEQADAESSLQAAEVLLENLGMAKDWTLVRQDTVSSDVRSNLPDLLYQFVFSQVIDGMIVDQGGMMIVEVVGGKIVHFEIQSPVEAVKAADPEPAVMTCEDAYALLKTYLSQDFAVIGSLYAYDSPEEQQLLTESLGEDFDVLIDTAEECLYYVRDSDDPAKGMIVPVWKFHARVKGEGDLCLYVNEDTGEIIDPARE